MTREEYAGWKRFQMTNAGNWTVDPIHDGLEGRDLIVFCGLPETEGREGIYVTVDRSGAWHSGRYTGAVPHIGDAEFTVKVYGNSANYDAALKHITERLGLSFLLALTHGQSPYRSL